jgi:hypothetical protein
VDGHRRHERGGQRRTCRYLGNGDGELTLYKRGCDLVCRSIGRHSEAARGGWRALAPQPQPAVLFVLRWGVRGDVQDFVAARRDANLEVGRGGNVSAVFELLCLCLAPCHAP